jgi:iron(III) transport system permease protein
VRPADQSYPAVSAGSPYGKPLFGIDTRRVVQIGLLLIVFVLVGGPLLVLLRTGFLPDGAVPLASPEFTLDQYKSVLSARGTFGLLRNTLIYSAGSVLMGVAIACLIAWLTERTDMPYRISIRVLMFTWMTVPPLVIGFGWILLINPSNGALNVLLKKLFDIQSSPLTPFTMEAMIFINGLAVVPTAFVMISGLLRNMDPKLEDAAFALGVSRWTILRRITLPLLTPGIVSIGIFLTMATIQSFDLPLILGLTAQVPVLSTRIYTLSSAESGISNYGLAAAYGTLFLVLAAVLMWIYFRTTQMSERYWVVSGKAFRPRRLALGRWRYPAVAGIAIYFALMLLPILILLWTSLFPFYRVPSFADLGQMSLGAYWRVLDTSLVKRALVNTVELFVYSATITVFLAGLVSWFSVRTKGWAGKALDLMSFSPMAIPPIVMGIAILVIYLRTPLYGTIWVLVIGYVTVYLPFATRAISSGLSQIHKELEDAAYISGASWWTSLRRVIFPLLLQQIVNAWLWIATHAARDLSFPLLLMTTSNVVLASAIWLTWSYPDLSGASALSMILLLGLTAFAVPIQIFAARQIERDG